MPITEDQTNAQANYVEYLKGKIQTEKDPSVLADYKNQLAGASKALTKYDRQFIVGPDGKQYSFSKGISKTRIDKYFTKQGWVKKGDQWYTKTGEPATGLGVPSETPQLTNAGLGQKKIALKKAQNPNIPSIGATAGFESLPSIGGAVGGILGKTPGAALGGMVGEATKDLAYRILYDPTISDKKELFNVLKEGAYQAGLEKLGNKAGDIFFNLVNKIPHAKVVDGIPMLPSDLKPGSRIRKYVEDLLSNLLPGAKTMEDFKVGQSKAVEKKLNLLIGGMGKFKGTSEQMGTLLQDAVRAAEADAKNNLKNIVKGLANPKDIVKTPEYKEYMRTFNDALVKRIALENKPELIAGYLRTDASGLEQIRTLQKAILEKNPTLWPKVRVKLMRDIVSEAMTGYRDPVAKTGTMVRDKFVGKDFKATLDKITEEKLKVIYGQEGYDNIENFVGLTSHLGNNAQAGVGKFLNLMFLLPLRSGITVKGATHLGITATVVNRAAKMITSTEGMKLYEGYIRAAGQQSPRAIKLAADEISAFNERSDKEYQQEHEENLEKFKEQNPDYNPQEAVNK